MDLPSGKRLAFSIVGNTYALRCRDGAAVVGHIALPHCDWYSPGKSLYTRSARPRPYLNRNTMPAVGARLWLVPVKNDGWPVT